MKKIVFFAFDPSPRIDRRIREFINEGYNVEVYGFANNVNIKYVTNDIYEYQVLSEINFGISYTKRLTNIKLVIDVIQSYDIDTTLFYFFTLNVAVATLFVRKISYVYEESDMLFDRCRSSILRNTVISINKRIIRNSKLTVFTSDGFREFYYGHNAPGNICVVPNRVSAECLSFPKIEKAAFDERHIRFGFVGSIRYQSILNVSKVVAEKFPDHEFHYFGNAEGLNESQKQELKSQTNVAYHGLFNNPTDLPAIYSSIDIVVCTYDVKGVNPRYAEPNKLYEALYFDTPIMVSSASFLADKVEKLGIGFSVDADNLQDIEDKIKSITNSTYQRYLTALGSIGKSESVNINKHLFDRIKTL